jgi:hypothetical protein
VAIVAMVKLRNLQVNHHLFKGMVVVREREGMNMLVSPSSKIERFFLITNDHIFTSRSHSDLIYCTKLRGTEGSFEISTHSLAKSADSDIFIKAFTLA